MLMVFGLNHYHINPDNVAIPLATALGELSTMGVLYGTSTYLYENQGKSIETELYGNAGAWRTSTSLSC